MSKSEASKNQPGPYANKGNLTEGDITKHLVRLTLPMVWGIFAIISFQLVDTFYISLLGTQKLAAITFTFPITYIVFSMTLGMGIATSSVLSRQIGEGDMDTVRRITGHAVITAGLFGLIIVCIGFLSMDAVFRLMGADDTMMPIIREYMVIWFAGSMFLTMPLVGNSAIRAAGDSLIPAIIMTVSAAVNIILDPLLIFGLLGFPELGVRGAAIATVFANACAMIAGLYVLAARKKLLTIDALLRHWHQYGNSLKRLMIIAVPAGLTSSIQPITNAVIISLLAAISAESVAAYGVVSRIEAFAFTTIMALASGMAPIIGQNWGAKKYNRVNETLNKALIFAAGWSLAIAIIFIIGGKYLVAPFVRDDAPAVLSTAMLYFWIVAPTYVFGNLVAGWGSAFNAMGKPQRSFMMIVVKMILINIPLAYLGNHYYGVIGIFGSIAFTNTVTGIAFHIMNIRLCHKNEHSEKHGVIVA